MLESFPNHDAGVIEDSVVPSSALTCWSVIDSGLLAELLAWSVPGRLLSVLDQSDDL